MGGSIAIAARFNDGQAICIDGWTNFIPRMVMNATTLSGDDAVVREIMLEAATHHSYDGALPLRPQGYGMVAIDFVAREIHSKQGYTSFGPKTLNQLLDMNASGWKDGVFTQVISDEAGGLLDAGRIRKVAIDGEACDPVVLDRHAATELLNADFLSFMGQGERTYVDLMVDTAPFTVHDYPEDGSLTAMKERLRSAGFPMTRGDGLNSMLTPRKKSA